MKAGQTSSGMVQLAGGVEHIERIKPQAAPAPCPPGQAPVPCPPVDPNAPMGPPIAVHEPAPGQRDVIEVVPNQPLIFDFNPLDLKAAQHQGSVVLTFPDGAQLELHDIVGPCGVQPTPFQLPDGTVITAGDLLQAFHLDVLGPCGLVEIAPAPPPIIPHEVPNTGFFVSPFEVGEIGPGIIGLGPLPPTGFGYFAEFLKGTGGSPFAPPGPPGPPGPPPPPGGYTSQEDSVLGLFGTDYTDSSVPPFSVTHPDYFADTNYGTGQPIFDISPTSPPLSVESYTFVPSDGSPSPPAVTPGPPGPGHTADGTYGDLTFNLPATSGSYTYQITNFSGPGGVSQLATDPISELLAQQGLETIQGSIPLAVYKDEFEVTTTNGTETDSEALNFYTFGVDAPAEAAIAANATVPPPVNVTLLLTYTDAVDPAHSFQEVGTVNSVTGAVNFTLESTTYIQPNDPALVTLEYVNNGALSTGQSVTISSVTIEGEQIASSVSLGPSDTGSGIYDAWSALINPNLGTSLLGTGQDPGDTGTPGTAVPSQTTGLPLGTFTDPNSNYTSTGYTGSYGFYDATTGAGNADTVNYTGAGGVTLTGSSTPGATTVFEWESSAPIDTTDFFNGSTAAIATPSTPTMQGLNVLELENAPGGNPLGSQTLDFTALSTSGANPNFQNVEVFDLTDAANSSVSNSIVLTAQSVFNLAQNEPNAVITFSNNAPAIFILGNSNDNVTLSGSWTEVNGAVTSSNPNDPTTPTPVTAGIPVTALPNNSAQVAGFTEYSANIAATPLPNGQTVSQVHVYVENAIAQAGNVHHA